VRSGSLAVRNDANEDLPILLTKRHFFLALSCSKPSGSPLAPRVETKRVAAIGMEPRNVIQAIGIFLWSRGFD